MFPRLTPTNRSLILANVIVFVLQLALPRLELYLALWPPQAANYDLPHFQVWQLLTYGFLHSSWAHIFFNMFALFMFGSDIEKLYGSKRYLAYYLLCVVGAAAMHLIVVSVAHLPPGPVVGASGGIFGILLAYGMAFPHRKLIIIPIPIPLSAWLYVTLYGLLELYMGITQTSQGVAHFAHLGGMATGFVLIRYWQSQQRRAR